MPPLKFIYPLSSAFGVKALYVSSLVDPPLTWTKVCSYKCLATHNHVQSVCSGHAKYKQVLLPPTCLVTEGSTDPSTWKVVGLDKGVTPIIAFVNPKAGGQMGEQIIKILNGILNPNQVFNLSRGGPEPGCVKFRERWTKSGEWTSAVVHGLPPSQCEGERSERARTR